MSQKQNIAVIGAGAWGKNIVRTVNELGALACVAEASAPLREGLKRDYPHLELLESYEPLLTRGDIQAVAIATPVPTHHLIAKRFLEAGKDVFVEKPMTLSAAEAADLLATAQAHGRILMVGHLLLYKPAIEFIKKYLASGHLGRIFSLHQRRAKLGKARAAENALWSLGVHDVAALLYLVGSTPESVLFSGHCGLQSAVEDDTYLHMTFASGTVAHLHNSWLWPEDSRGLIIVGEKGMLGYDEKAETVTLYRKSIDAGLNNVDHGVETLFTAPAGFQALQAEMQHFIECLTTRKNPRSDGQNGLDVIAVLEKAKAKTA